MGAFVYSGPGACPCGDDVAEQVAALPAPEAAEDAKEEEPAAAEFNAEVLEDAATELPMAVSKPAAKKRARHPKGAEAGKGGEFIADDPATPEDEAWEA